MVSGEIKKSDLQDNNGEYFVPFKNIEKSVLDALLPHCRIVNYAADKEIPLNGEIYIIRDGYVSLWSRNAPNSYGWNYYLAWRGPGDILGEMGAFHQDPNPAKVKTTDEVEVLAIKVKHFMSAASQSSQIYQNLLQIMIDKVLDYGVRAEVLQMKQGMPRVARTLEILAKARPGLRGAIHGHVRSIDIAGFIGGSVGDVRRKLKELVKAGIIEYIEEKQDIDGNSIRILKPDMLHDLI